MTTAERPDSYTKVTQWLHWIVLFVIMGSWFGGFVMIRIPDSPMKTTFFHVHIIEGYIVLVLTTARIVARLTSKTPDLPRGMSGIQATTFRAVHLGLYVVMVFMVITGPGMLMQTGVGLNPFNVQPDLITFDLPARIGHDVFSKLFALLFLAHLGGVMLHQFTESDVMKRMGIGWFPGKKETD